MRMSHKAESVDCLNNLEMHLPVELPSGDVLTVDLEYENLQKHCFYCYSLFHEVDDCPTKPTTAKVTTHELGISQHNTLRNLEEHRRRQDHHRASSTLSRNSVSHSRGDQATSRPVYSERIGLSGSERYHSSYDSRQPGRAQESYQREHQRERYDRRGSRDRSPAYARQHHPPSERAHYSHASRTPPPVLDREPRNLLAIPERTERSGHSLERRSALERLEKPQ